MPMSKLAAVKIAMEKLGDNAKTQEIQDYLKQHYNLVITRPMCATYKSNVKAKSKPEANEPEANEPEANEPEANEPEANEPEAYSIEDLETLKDLIARHGSESLNRLIRILTDE